MEVWVSLKETGVVETAEQEAVVAQMKEELGARGHLCVSGPCRASRWRNYQRRNENSRPAGASKLGMVGMPI